MILTKTDFLVKKLLLIWAGLCHLREGERERGERERKKRERERERDVSDF